MIRNLKVNPTQIFFLNVFIQCVLSESYYVNASCNIPDFLKKEIESYETAVQKIIEYTVSGPFKGKTYDELAKFVDTFGSRLSGTENLENAIDYMVNRTRQEGLDNIVTEEVKVPYWMRCNEKLTMILPRVKNIELLSLGYSVSTPLGGITAEIVVVPDFETIENMSEDYVRGKIVLFNPTFTTYAETVKYRTNGAVKAAEKGAVAALVRSITPFSLSTPHTGTLSYDEHIKKIPYASITIEDSELIKRITDRGIKVILSLDITSKLETRLSRNTLIDLEGTEAPEKLVIVSGHIDSWDVGQGAMDDGGGMFVSWAAPIILKKLNLTPKRTIRTIFWTAEELGLIGAYAYEKAHRNESHNINFIMESDEGTFAPLGLAVGGTDDTRCIIAYVLDLFERINATALVKDDAPGSDIAIFTSNGIPGASLYNANDRYFWYHHTEADTMTVEDPHELDLGAAFWTAAAYIIADLSIDMPR